jgi:hypothetical protein
MGGGRMTVLALERTSFVDPETTTPFDTLILAADSRITRGNEVTTDVAPKILPIHMTVGDKYGRRTFFPPYGFAFAGSVTSAFLTHSTAEHCLVGLFGDINSNSPSVMEVAQIYSDICRLQIREVGIRLPADQAKAALFEAIICGLSSDTGEIAAFHIAPTLGAELEIVLR